MSFIKLSASYLKSIAGKSERLPKLYYHPIPLARDFFWLRLIGLYGLADRYVINKGKCLDFACGSGIFLPSLATLFERVVGIDLEINEAQQLVNDFNLANVILQEGDLNQTILGRDFDAVFAADVLEHFADLNLPTQQIYNCLSSEGWLLTSLPTENWFTRLTRILGGYKKPIDHYHTGEEVEQFLTQYGFIKVASRLIVPVYPLYYLGVWRKC